MEKRVGEKLLKRWANEAHIFFALDCPDTCQDAYELATRFNNFLASGAASTLRAIAKARVIALSASILHAHNNLYILLFEEFSRFELRFSFERDHRVTVIIDYAKNLAEKYCVVLCYYPGGAKQKSKIRSLEQAEKTIERIYKASENRGSQRGSGSKIRREETKRLRTKSLSACDKPKKKTDSDQLRDTAFVNTSEEIKLLLKK